MRKLRQAFTLLELIVVIVILGLLAAMVVPTFKNIIDTSKLEITEVSAASFARQTVALAGLDTPKYGGKIMQEHALLTAADMPMNTSLPAQAAQAAQAAELPTEGRLVVFGNWEFSGNTNTLSVKLADDGARMGVAISVPDVGCAFALADGNTVTSWNVKGIDVTNCNGAGAFVDEEEAKGFLPPARPGGLKIGYGTCSPGVDGWNIMWEENVYVDIFINGVYQGVGKAKDLCIPGKETDVVTVVTRPKNPQDELIEELNPETPPAGRPGSAGSVGEVLDDEVIEIPVPDIGNPHNPKDPSQVEEEEIIVKTPTTVVIDWDKTKVPAEAEELIIIRTPSNGPPREIKVPAGQEEAVNEELPPGDYTYVVRPVKDGQPVGPDLPVTVAPVERPVPVPAAAGSAVTVVGDTVNLIWGTVPNTPQAPLTGYKVYRSATNTGPWVEMAIVENNIASYSDTGLDAGVYFYTVTSFGPGGESARSVVARAEVISLPQAPINLRATPLNTKTVLNWTPVATALSYKVYNDSGVELQTVNSPTATIEGLTNDVSYTFYVVATNVIGDSNKSSNVTVIPKVEIKTFINRDAIEAWIVPEGVTQIEAQVRGGAGALALGRGNPGAGAAFKVLLNVTPGETLYFKAGQNGNAVKLGNYDGGISPNGSDGGGSTDIRSGGKELEHRIIVAGGGGGSGYSSVSFVSRGGAGGLPGGSGGDGASSTYADAPGLGGTQAEPGRGPVPGVANVGGNGAKSSYATFHPGAGGGGGYFGGGGGAGQTNSSKSSGSGGGGSSYIAPGVTEGTYVTTNLKATVGIIISY